MWQIKRAYEILKTQGLKVLMLSAWRYILRIMNRFNPMIRFNPEMRLKPVRIERDGAVFKVTARNGKKWFIPTKDENFGFWAFIFMKKVERYLDAIKDGDTVVEVGACTGEYTVPAAKKVGNFGRIFACEADSLGCECIRKNAKLYKRNNIQVINQAVSDRIGRKMALDIRGNLSGGILVEGNTMQTTTIDSLFSDMKIDVLKMTTNGHEPEIVAGAKKTLESVRCVVFQSARHKELIKILEYKGFKVTRAIDDSWAENVRIVLLERKC